MTALTEEDFLRSYVSFRNGTACREGRVSGYGQGRVRTAAGVLAALLLSAVAVPAWGKDGHHDTLRPAEASDRSTTGPETKFHVSLTPFLSLTAAGGEEPLRGVNFLFPLGDGPLRFELKGRVGVHLGTGNFGAGGVLNVSFEF